jgi:flagellar motor switch protein FliN/FliY
MTSAMTDNDFDSLINDSDLNLAPIDAPATAGFSLDAPAQLPHQDLSFFGKIPVNVTLEVASTEIPLKDLMDVDASSVIVLDKLAGEPLDVKVNGALFAKAEVVVVNGNYGLRIVELSGTSLNDIAQ